jgi:GAF domain-containing protein/HAMP domain-containing protein
MFERIKATIGPIREGKGPVQNLGRLLFLLATIAVATIGSFVLLYLQTGAWQMLVVAGAVAIALGLTPVAYYLARRGQVQAAGYLVLFGLLVVYGGNELAISGGIIYNIVGGILLIFLAGSIVLRGRWRVWLVTAGLYAFYLFLVNQYRPLPRFDMAQSPMLRLYAPGANTLLALATLWLIVRAFRIGTIRTRLLISFVAIALLPVLTLAIGLAVGGLQSWTYKMLGITVGAGLLGVLIAVGASLFITRGIATPVAGLARTATQIALGDLTQVARVEREDEIGTLAQAFNSMTVQLRDLIGSLEHRVYERTRELERRSSYLQASAVVSQAATSILETDELIQQVVELIREHFGLYYVGLFLLDEAGEWATLRAGTGEAGRAMLLRGHQIKVGEGMIGWSVAHAEPRVTLEAGEDAIRLATPELPDTRSEAALPLRSARRAGQAFGALTVQHTEPGAFDEEAITLLQTMADQVAVALDNARLFAERQKAVETLQRVYGELSRQAWTDILRAQPMLGYRSDEQGTTHIAKAGDFWRMEMDQALQTGQTTQGVEIGGDDADGKRTLAVPIKVRGQVVGVLDTFKPAEAGDWTPEEISMLEAIAAQLDPALESARLYQDTQRRAAREQTIRHVTDQMRRAVDMETILQNTVVELAKAMGAPRAYVRLGTGMESQPSAGSVHQSSAAAQSSPSVEADQNSV